MRVGASRQYVERERARQLDEIARRVRLFRSVLPKVALRERVVIVSDDGLATSATMQAPLWEIRREQAAFVAAAVPVGALETLERHRPATTPP